MNTEKTFEQLAEQAHREAAKCMYCGFCEAVCPTLYHGPHRGYGPRGRLLVAKTLLETKNPTPEALASIYSCLACRACTVKCVVGIEVGVVMHTLRYLYSKGYFGKPDFDKVVIEPRGLKKKQK